MLATVDSGQERRIDGERVYVCMPKEKHLTYCNSNVCYTPRFLLSEFFFFLLRGHFLGVVYFSEKLCQSVFNFDPFLKFGVYGVFDGHAFNTYVFISIYI